jgi:hypothetical protein
MTGPLARRSTLPTWQSCSAQDWLAQKPPAEAGGLDVPRCQTGHPQRDRPTARSPRAPARGLWGESPRAPAHPKAPSGSWGIRRSATAGGPSPAGPPNGPESPGSRPGLVGRKSPGSRPPKSPQRKLGDSTFRDGWRAIPSGTAQRPGVPGLPPGACGGKVPGLPPTQKPPAEAGGFDVPRRLAGHPQRDRAQTRGLAPRSP